MNQIVFRNRMGLLQVVSTRQHSIQTSKTTAPWIMDVKSKYIRRLEDALNVF